MKKQAPQFISKLQRGSVWEVGGWKMDKRLLTCWFAEFNLLTSFLMRGSEVMTQSGKVKGKSSKDSQTGGRSVSSTLSRPWKFISTHMHTEQTNSNLRDKFIKMCKCAKTIAKTIKTDHTVKK